MRGGVLERNALFCWEEKRLVRNAKKSAALFLYSTRKNLRCVKPGQPGMRAKKQTTGPARARRTRAVLAARHGFARGFPRAPRAPARHALDVPLFLLPVPARGARSRAARRGQERAPRRGAGQISRGRVGRRRRRDGHERALRAHEGAAGEGGEREHRHRRGGHREGPGHRRRDQGGRRGTTHARTCVPRTSASLRAPACDATTLSSERVLVKD